MGTTRALHVQHAGTCQRISRFYVAAALPAKLTVPMILFFLPVLFIVILGPAGINISQKGLLD